MGLNAQYQTTTPAFRLTDAPTSGYTLSASDPSGVSRPLAAYLQATTQNIRFTIDGTAPTASVGMLLVAGAEPFYYDGPLVELRFIQTASGAVLNVVYTHLFDGAPGHDGVVQSVVAGNNVSVDSSDPANPIVSADGSLTAVEAGDGIAVDNTNPQAPVVSNDGVISIVAGSNITVDNTDPQNPVVASTGGGGALIVEDNFITVNPTTTLKFLSNFQVSDAGGGEADVALDLGLGPNEVLGTNSGATLVGLPIIGFAVNITSPLQISGCQLWLDASDATTINSGTPSDGDPVSTWADKSTSGFDATQGTPDNRPVYKTSIQNSLAVVRLDPTSFPQHLVLSGGGLDLFRNLSGSTVASVARPAAKTSASPIISAGVVIGANPIFEHFAHSQDLFTTMYDPGFSNSFGPSMNRYATLGTDTSDTQSAYAGVLAADMVSGSFGALTTLFANTGQPANSATTPHTPDVSATSIVIGGDYLLGATWNADICELIVYNRALNAVETRQVYEYLAAKWNTF